MFLFISVVHSCSPKAQNYVETCNWFFLLPGAEKRIVSQQHKVLGIENNCFVGQQPSKLQVADQELKVDANGVGMQSRHALVPRAAATL